MPDGFNQLVERAVALHRSGDFVTAEAQYGRALRHAPRRADLHHLRGLAAHQAGHHIEAAKWIGRAVQLDPEIIAYRVNLAIVLNALGEYAAAEAAAREAITLNPADSEAYNNLARAQAGQGLSGEAIISYRAALFHDAGNAAASANLATVLMSLGRDTEAEAACRTAIKIDASLVQAWHSFGVVLAARGRLDEAESAFTRVLTLAPRHVQATINLASIYATTDRPDAAMALFRKALALSPNSVEAYLNLGKTLAELGRVDEAVASLRKAIDLDSDNIEAWYALATSGAVALETAAVDRLACRTEAMRLTEDQRIKLQFVRAWEAHQQDHFARAFTHFKRGNDARAVMLARQGKGFDVHAHFARISDVIEASPAAVLAQPLARAEDGPVFVVGLPRSGTTLVERIIAAHPQAAGIGERDDIADLATAFTADNAAELAERYRTELRARAPQARLIVDKTPFNYLHLGAIARLLPGAKIIHIRRDPRDVALSCYQQNFTQPQGWSCRLPEMGDYIGDYLRLMAHWREALPGGLFEIDYETLVAEPEAQARRLMAYLGLEWDAACLDFHRRGGAVRSASKWQVRRPIYASSIGRWQDYAIHLRPLLDRLPAESLA